MHLLICFGEDKYLLTLPGFLLICLNSAQSHHLKLMARALLAQPKVLNLSARSDRRLLLQAEHPNLPVSQMPHTSHG